MTLSNHQLLPNKTENTTNNDNDTTANDATADMADTDNTGEDHAMPKPNLQYILSSPIVLNNMSRMLNIGLYCTYTQLIDRDL